MCWPSQRGHKMHLKLYWPTPPMEIKCILKRTLLTMSARTQDISRCVHQIPPLPARSPNASKHLLTKPIHWKWGQKMYLIVSTHVEIHFISSKPIPRRTHKVSQHVLTKLLTCLRGDKMYLNMFDFPWQRNQLMYLNMCWKTHPMPARTQNISQIVLTDPLKWQEDTKCFSIFVD